jgi:hypothetical protein
MALHTETQTGTGNCAVRFTKTENVSFENIGGLLCSAFEGGSNYWYEIHDYVEPKEITFQAMKGEVFPHIDYPLNVGGAVIVGDMEAPEEAPKRLDMAAIKNGLKVMAEKYPHHWQDFVSENDDAITGDVFLQCCLFGEIVFG